MPDKSQLEVKNISIADQGAYGTTFGLAMASSVLRVLSVVPRRKKERERTKSGCSLSPHRPFCQPSYYLAFETAPALLHALQGAKACLLRAANKCCLCRADGLCLPCELGCLAVDNSG